MTGEKIRLTVRATQQHALTIGGFVSVSPWARLFRNIHGAIKRKTCLLFQCIVPYYELREFKSLDVSNSAELRFQNGNHLRCLFS
jgi:hypothetical protein